MSLIKSWREGVELIRLIKADQMASSGIINRNNFPTPGFLQLFIFWCLLNSI